MEVSQEIVGGAGAAGAGSCAVVAGEPVPSPAPQPKRRPKLGKLILIRNGEIPVGIAS